LDRVFVLSLAYVQFTKNAPGSILIYRLYAQKHTTAAAAAAAAATATATATGILRVFLSDSIGDRPEVARALPAALN